MDPFACRRCARLAVLILLVAHPARAGVDPILIDDFESGDSCLWGVGPETCPGFSITTPPLQVEPGQEVAYCYYFHTGNSGIQGVRRIVSAMEGAAVYTSLLTTHDTQGNPVDIQPPGTLTSAGCDFGGGNLHSRRVYTAHELDEELLLPADDGTGSPLALEFLAGQPAVLVAHLINVTDQPLMTTVTLTAYAHAPEVSYTKAATFTTFDTQLTLPPMSVSTSTHTCAVPTGVKFWWFSTHTHGYAQEAKLRNGLSDIVISTDWQSPAIASFGPPGFYEFGVGEQITYSCTYWNNQNFTILDGESYLTDENCVGLAYFFPANAPRLCVNNVLIP
jgi:hypothetical protein